MFRPQLAPALIQLMASFAESQTRWAKALVKVCTPDQKEPFAVAPVRPSLDRKDGS